MFIEGVLTDTRRSSGSDLNTYCKLEGMDYHYLASVKHKKSSRKTTAGSIKKLVSLKLFGI
jgi:hypothetical protein